MSSTEFVPALGVVSALISAFTSMWIHHHPHKKAGRKKRRKPSSKVQKQTIS